MLANSKRLVIWKLVIKFDKHNLDLEILMIMKLILKLSIKIMFQKMLFSTGIFIN